MPTLLILLRIKTSMNAFFLSGFAQTITLLGTLILLTSCSYHRKPRHVDTPPKTFQYSYQNPARKLLPSDFARKLSTGKVGERAFVRVENGKFSTVRLGENYFSANGYTCRRYTKESAIAMSACKINNRWYQAQPIFVNQ